MQVIESDKNLFWVPILLILYNFCANLANDIYLPSMPILEHSLKTTSGMLQLTMTSWFAGVASPQLFFGPLSDRFGRRPILFIGGLCFLISTAVCGIATNVYALIIARFFQGVGVCSLNVATYAILIDLYNYQNRTKIMTKINMVGTMAPLLGPILGGYILYYFGWRVNFIIIFVMGLISLIGLWLKLPESNLNLNQHALSLKNMAYNYLQLLQSKGFMKNLLPACLILGGLIVYLTSAPFIIIDRLHVPAQLFGYTQLPIFLAYILGALYLSFVKEEQAIKLVLTRGLYLVFIAGLLMLFINYFFHANLWLFIFPMIIYSLGSSLCGSPLVNEVMSSATAAKGSAAAFLGFGMSVSCMLSSLILGLIYNGTIILTSILICSIATFAVAIYFIPFNRDYAVDHSVVD